MVRATVELVGLRILLSSPERTDDCLEGPASGCTGSKRGDGVAEDRGEEDLRGSMAREPGDGPQLPQFAVVVLFWRACSRGAVLGDERDRRVSRVSSYGRQECDPGIDITGIWFA